MILDDVHLSGKQIDDGSLKIHGIIKEADAIPQLTITACSRSRQVNGPTSGFCSRCGMAMRLDSAVDLEKKRYDITIVLVSEQKDLLFLKMVISKKVSEGK